MEKCDRVNYNSLARGHNKNTIDIWYVRREQNRRAVTGKFSETRSISASSPSRNSKSSISSGCYSMLPSARERIENQHTFLKHYKLLCEINNSVPKVKVGADQKLEFYGDRIRMEDWAPIIKAIEQDQSLQVIKICNRNLSQPGSTKNPALYTKKILNGLVVALHQCLSLSKSLAILRIEAIPFSLSNLKVLLKGVKENSSLRCLELPHCNLGTEGCELLCRVLRYQTNINSLDLSSCGISSDSAHHISQIIQVQKLIMYGDCWKQSLRYRSPKLTAQGLCSLILNNNVNLLDDGFSAIVNSLFDDLWFTELHCRNCGLTNESVEETINLLSSNTYIKCVDLRNNLLIDPELLLTMEAILNRNANNIVEKMYNSNEDVSDVGYKNNDKITVNFDYTEVGIKQTNNQAITEATDAHFRPSTFNLPSITFHEVKVPPLELSYLQRNNKSRKLASEKQKTQNELLQIKKVLHNMKIRLHEEMAKRMAAEEYCTQLETQLKVKKNCTVIEKSALERLIRTCYELSYSLHEIQKNQSDDSKVMGKMKDDKYINSYHEDRYRELKSSSKSENKALNDCLENVTYMKKPHKTMNNSRTQLEKDVISNPTLKAQLLFNELLKQSSTSDTPGVPLRRNTYFGKVVK